jgi:hypothetical protein
MDKLPNLVADSLKAQRDHKLSDRDAAEKLAIANDLSIAQVLEALQRG